MDAYLQIWGDAGAEILPVDRARTVIGREPTNDVALVDDAAVSRVHAVIEQYPSGWSIRDLGSVNGTYVNGRLLASERALCTGDEVRIGSTQLIFRTHARERSGPTVSLATTPPTLTRRERDVLVELCRPAVAAGLFQQPATIADIARTLVVSEAAVKFHLANLYEKFGISDRGPGRRAALAAAALEKGAISRAELRSAPFPHPG